MEYNQPDLLVSTEPILVQASQGKRLANYVIDIISFYLVLIVIGIVVALIAPDLLSGLDSDDPMSNLLDRLVSLILYAVYMGAIEAATKGKSLGKIITGTLAVNEDGSTISTKTAFVRGFSRAVPFSVFSAFGTPCYPWQDKWTNTYVIDKKESTLM